MLLHAWQGAGVRSGLGLGSGGAALSISLVCTLPFSCAACFLALGARSSWQRSLMRGRLRRRSTLSLMHSACTAAQAESVNQ